MRLANSTAETNTRTKSADPASTAGQGACAWRVPESLQQFEKEGEADVLEEIIVAFVTDGAYRLKELRRAAMAGELPELRAHAHSLKGSSNQLGVPRIATICEQIEGHGGHQPESELVFLVDAIETIFHCTSKEMLAHVAAAAEG